MRDIWCIMIEIEIETANGPLKFEKGPDQETASLRGKPPAFRELQKKYPALEDIEATDGAYHVPVEMIADIFRHWLYSKNAEEG